MFEDKHITFIADHPILTWSLETQFIMGLNTREMTLVDYVEPVQSVPLSTFTRHASINPNLF